MKKFNYSQIFRAPAAICAGLMLTATAHAQTTLFQDDFNSAWDNAKWRTYDDTRKLQRTQFGLAPFMASESGTNFARFNLHTYNADPDFSGFLRGTEVVSNAQFSLGNGVEFEARLRGKNLPRGIVFAFFSYGERGDWPTTYLKEEIDFEFLTNFTKDKIWLNIWDDWNPSRGGPNKATATTASGNDWNDWHTYKIRWTNTATEWYVDNRLIRTSTDILPNDPMTVRFNIWAAASGWTTAYDANLVPASSPSANRTYSMDVDWVKVSALPAPTGAVVGNGIGLSGSYFNNADFTGTNLRRVDAQVKYNWGNLSPDPALGADTFSARWTGQVQAQYSEQYTFTARADDGGRLWVNGQKLVDAWKNQGPTEYSGNITLVAGQKYDIRYEYYENTGGAVAQLFWSSPRTPKQLVPQIQLYPVDTAPPTIGIVYPGTGNSYRTQRIFTGTASDADTYLVAVNGRLYDTVNRLYWNGSSWTTSAADFAISGTENWTFAPPFLPDGRYTFTATARDAVGFTSSTASTFRMDTTPPVVAVASPGNGAVFATLTAATGTASDTGLSQVALSLQRQSDGQYWNGTAWTAQAVFLPAVGTTSWSLALPQLAEGTYTLTPQAKDFAGNIGVGPAVNFMVDASGPEVVVSSPIANGSYAALTSATGTASDAPSGVNRVQIRLWRPGNNTAWNGSAWISSTSLANSPSLNVTGKTSWNYAMPPLPTGSYLIQIVARDNVGNVTYASPVRFTVTSPPALQTENEPSE